MLRERLGPLGDRRFRLLWLGRTSSALGDGLVPVALAFAIVGELHGGARSLGLVLAVSSVARVAFTLIGGVWADRLPRRAVMVVCDLVRAVVELATFALLIAGAMEVWMFALAGAVFGAASAFFYPASTGLVAETVPQSRFQQANALLSMSWTGAGVIGPAVAGILVATAGAAWVFAIDGVTFAASAVFLGALRLEPHVRPVKKRFLAELAEGWREVTARTWLWVPYISFSLSNLVNGTFWVLGPLVFANQLGGASEWGLAMSIAAAGGFVGSLLVLRWRPRRPLVAAFLVWSLGALPPLTLVRPLPAVLVGVGAGLWLAGITAGSAIWTSTMQALIPRDKLGRVDSYDWLISLVFQPLGLALAGTFASVIGLDTTLLIAAALSAFVHLAVLALPSLRAIRRTDLELAPISAAT
jgi:MFS family permease